MWHSQILGSFEAKNITCGFVHENYFLVTEITKDIFPDDKKYKKVQKIVLKGFFCSNWSDMEVQKSGLFASICLIWRFTQAYWHTPGPNHEFSIPRGCLGVYGKFLILRIA